MGNLSKCKRAVRFGSIVAAFALAAILMSVAAVNLIGSISTLFRVCHWKWRLAINSTMCDRCGCAFAVTAASGRTCRAPVERGRSSLRTEAAPMSNNLSLAQEFAYSLATSPIACVTLFPLRRRLCRNALREFDGEPDSVLHIYDRGRTDRAIGAGRS